MSILWPFRQQCSQLILRHFTSNSLQPIAIANIHTKARQSPYPGANNIHVRFLRKKRKNQSNNKFIIN